MSLFFTALFTKHGRALGLGFVALVVAAFAALWIYGKGHDAARGACRLAAAEALQREAQEAAALDRADRETDAALEAEVEALDRDFAARRKRPVTRGDYRRTNERLDAVLQRRARR